MRGQRPDVKVQIGEKCGDKPWGGGVLPQGLNQVEISEFMKLHKSMEDLDVELVSVGEKT